jgi:hypothetical protein
MGGDVMRAWRIAAAVAALGIVVAGAFAAEEAGIVLLDAPRGAWLGEVRQDAPVQVLEERDGWRRIRVEGWVRDTAPLPAGAPGAGAASSAPGAAPAAAAAPAATALRGVLTPRQGMQPATVGGGLAVLFVPDPAATDAAHRTLGEPCRAALAEIDKRLEGLNDELQASLNSSSNFKEAAQKNDRAKAALATAKQERADRLAACRGQAEAYFSGRAVARTVSDAAGRFEISGLPPGRYRVVAMERTAAGARGWSMSADVPGAADLLLEGSAADGPDPYWNLR